MATTENSLDDNLVEFVSSMGVDIFRGRENNVLDRFYNAAKKFEQISLLELPQTVL